jgi:hypothetical protein
MNNKEFNELILDLLIQSYPIMRIRIPNKFHGEILPNGGIRTKNNFKKVIRINEHQIYRISDNDERYTAMIILNRILCKIFSVNEDITMPIIKKHLHIK